MTTFPSRARYLATSLPYCRLKAKYSSLYRSICFTALELLLGQDRVFPAIVAAEERLGADVQDGRDDCRVFRRAGSAGQRGPGQRTARCGAGISPATAGHGTAAESHRQHRPERPPACRPSASGHSARTRSRLPPAGLWLAGSLVPPLAEPRLPTLALQFSPAPGPSAAGSRPRRGRWRFRRPETTCRVSGFRAWWPTRPAR